MSKSTTDPPADSYIAPVKLLKAALAEVERLRSELDNSRAEVLRASDLKLDSSP